MGTLLPIAIVVLAFAGMYFFLPFMDRRLVKRQKRAQACTLNEREKGMLREHADLRRQAANHPFGTSYWFTQRTGGEECRHGWIVMDGACVRRVGQVTYGF
jgi:hypothetical protein